MASPVAVSVRLVGVETPDPVVTTTGTIVFEHGPIGTVRVLTLPIAPLSWSDKAAATVNFSFTGPREPLTSELVAVIVNGASLTSGALGATENSSVVVSLFAAIVAPPVTLTPLGSPATARSTGSLAPLRRSIVNAKLVLSPCEPTGP